jgi:hypothetical protein
MRISGWRGKARRRDEWKSVLRRSRFFKESSAIGYRYTISLIGNILGLSNYKQGYFCDGSSRDTLPEALNQKNASPNSVLEHFFPAICFTRLVVCCYHIPILSNKLTYFVQILKEKLSPSDNILDHS